MFSIRIISLAAVLLGSFVANAAPMPAVAEHHVKPGAVYTAKPAHFDPPLVRIKYYQSLSIPNFCLTTDQPGHSSTHGSASGHPVVALGHPDHEGWVPVAAVSHNHPEHMGETHDASHYHQNTHAAGTGSFNAGSRIAVAAPTHVHVSNLNHVHPDSNLPHQLHPTDTNALVNAVRTSLFSSRAVSSS